MAQQRSVIGTFRALGLSRGAIISHYLGFGLVVGIVGGLGGIALGAWLQGGMLKLYRVFFAIPDINRGFHPHIIASGLIVALFFATTGTFKSSLARVPARAGRGNAPSGA